MGKRVPLNFVGVKVKVSDLPLTDDGLAAAKTMSKIADAKEKLRSQKSRASPQMREKIFTVPVRGKARAGLMMRLDEVPVSSINVSPSAVHWSLSSIMA